MDDYGLGFYCTESIGLAKEWACRVPQDGFANGITQEQLAVKSTVPIRLIRAYEQGKIRMSKAEYGTIARLKLALNCE